MPHYDSYIICTSPRSGSTLLCRLLKATGRSGNPNSYFHRPSLSQWLDAHDLSAQNYETDLDALHAIFQTAINTGKADTDLFGLRLQRHSFAFFTEQLERLYPDASSDKDRLKEAFGAILYIYLNRGDKLDQAISIVKAKQTGLWHKNADGSELERLAPHQEPQYDHEALQKQLTELTQFHNEWEDWFEAQGIEPHRITYDDLSANPQGSLAEILDLLGLDGSIAKSVETPTARLSDTINQQWASRFKTKT